MSQENTFPDGQTLRVWQNSNYKAGNIKVNAETGVYSTPSSVKGQFALNIPLEESSSLLEHGVKIVCWHFSLPLSSLWCALFSPVLQYKLPKILCLGLHTDKIDNMSRLKVAWDYFSLLYAMGELVGN